MRAIILAAGIGKRLAEKSAGRPKCLLKFGDSTLLHRHVAALTQLGITEICVVTGYQHDEVEAELNSLDSSVHVDTVFNPDYTSGSIISLLKAKDYLESGSDLIVMDADVLYHPGILEKLTTSRIDNCFLLDRNFEPGDEPVKICVQDGNIVEFRKKIAADLKFDYQGESVGFFRFGARTGYELAGQCQKYVDENNKDAPYEEAIRDLLLSTPGKFGFEDISGLPWIEIDFPEDVDRADNEILKKINTLT